MDKQYLKELVGNGDLEQAFQSLLSYGKGQKAKEWHNALWIQYNRLKELEQNSLKGTLSVEEADRIKNRILSALLSLIDDLPVQEEEAAASGMPPPLPAGKARWAKWVLIGAAVLAGLIAGYSKLKPAVTRPAAEPTASEASIPEEASSSSQALRFPQGSEVTFIFSTGIEISYRILSGEMESLGGDARQVSFTIRCSGRKGNGVNFWDDTFRLELDEAGALLEPSSGLNEVVENNSYKDGTVSFVVKGPVSSMKLAIVNPWDQGDIRKLAVDFKQ
ncbi:MAG: hypothetical protein H6556_19445 [Lewinellaceae bacterium]|nr:hypothetical protein [Lewinellaceae bacterium]